MSSAKRQEALMKHIKNYTKEEFKAMYIDIPYDIVEIVYDYLRRDKTYTVLAFARQHHISTATLYRYIKRVREHR